MEQRNHTPFPVHAFQGKGRNHEPLLVAMVQGRFRMLPNRALVPIANTPSAIVTDSYFGASDGSSLNQAGNLVVFKPNSEIHLQAKAYAPKGLATPIWQVKFSLGKLSKGLRITGPRSWYHQANTWQLSAPAPISSLPIRYEHAYGGAYSHEGQQRIFAKNPFGHGYADPSQWDPSKRYPAHQIEAPGGWVSQPGKDYLPQGFGPLTSSARAAFRQVLGEQNPYASNHSAHPDLIYPGFLEGYETMTLENLSAGGFLRIDLPDYAMLALVRYQDGSILPAKLALDTVAIDTEDMKAALTWRLPIDASRPIRVLEYRLARDARQALAATRKQA